MKPKAVIVCPGRGTYNRTELGYIARHHADKLQFLKRFDEQRVASGRQPVSDLDAADKYLTDFHASGENAAALIFAASFLDSLDAKDAFDVVAVTGNSMGWYTTLAVAGAAQPTDAFNIVNTMGALMQESMLGGQCVYPFVGEDWRHNPSARGDLLALVDEINARDGHTLAVSIELGGMLVLAGDEKGLAGFEAAAPQVRGRFPLKLPNHSAFHTTMQIPVAESGRDLLKPSLFGMGDVPMIDGRGSVWYPRCYSQDDLHAYTLGKQVVEAYDFTSSIRVAARTFAPDVFVVLGPGDTLGGAVAQSLIAINWKGLDCKSAFQDRQKKEPVILSMGREDDRSRMNDLAN